MFSVNRKSHVIRHMMTPRFVVTPKSYAFEEILKMGLIDSIPQIEISWTSG